VCIAGGYDLANLPDIGYGLQQGGLPRVISGMVFRLANRILPFSEYAYHETLSNTLAKAQNTFTIPLGIPQIPALAESSPKEPLAITIGTIDRLSAERKGIRAFVEAARLLPDVPFIVAGKGRDHTIDDLKRIAPPNVRFTGYLPDEELIALQKRAKVYVQASVHEGFGLALAESMLARCIPVVTRRAALPEVVGDTGIMLDDNRPDTISKGIRAALLLPDAVGEHARTRILENFSLEKRVQSLYHQIDMLMESRR
jgi:glycosyltransferase involved in cell wall biosynthesis